MVVLGTGEERYTRFFLSLQQQYPEYVGTKISYDEWLAHKIEGGADLFLMPSRFEPCGLNQIYSLKYGTVPLVRATGGLDDTIQDYSQLPNGTGFKFEGYSPEE
jgi:starch synthase